MNNNDSNTNSGYVFKNTSCPVCGEKTKITFIQKLGKSINGCPNRVYSQGSYSGCEWTGEWEQTGTSRIQIEETNELCNICGKPLIIKTLATGKKLKDCSNKKWDSKNKSNTPDSCEFQVQWLDKVKTDE